MAKSLEAIALEIATKIFVDWNKPGKAGKQPVAKVDFGPVFSVVRDNQSGDLVFAINGNLPQDLSNVMEQSIRAQGQRIVAGEVIVVRTDPRAAEGGHAEVIALNKAELLREQRIGRKLLEAERTGFELHNVWLTGTDRQLTPAPR